MDYRNFIIRMLISFILITLYISISLINFELIFYLIMIIYLLVIIEVFYFFKKLKYIILIYIVISFISLLRIEFDKNLYLNFSLMIFIIITFDVFSYLVGIYIGKLKLLKKISPNKTLEGFIGGATISFICSLLFLILFSINVNLLSILFIIIIISSSFIGDIIESIFKRNNNLKNSSNFLPGHGGFFDRFDSFIFAIIVYSFIYKIL